MQTVDLNTQMNRLFTQPDSIDIADVSINVVPDIMKKKIACRSGVQIQMVDTSMPLFTKGEYRTDARLR